MAELYQAFFDDANPQLLAHESIEDTYTPSDNILIVLAPKDGDVFTSSTLALISELTDFGQNLCRYSKKRQAYGFYGEYNFCQ